MSYFPVNRPTVTYAGTKGLDQEGVFSSFSSECAYVKTGVALNSLASTLLFTTNGNLGQFAVTDVWMHIDSITVNTQTVTISVGWNAASYNNVVAATSKGGLGAASLPQFKFLRLPTSTVVAATTANASIGFYARVSSAMASPASATIVVVGYYTGARP